MKAKHLPNEYWVEAIACAVYILNHFTTQSVKDYVPHEAWSNKRNNVSHLRVFAYIAYAHVPTKNRKNLDNK